MASSMPRPHFTPGKGLVPILQEDGWAPGPGWTGRKSRPNRDSILNSPAHSQSLYRLNYPAHHKMKDALNYEVTHTKINENQRKKIVLNVQTTTVKYRKIYSSDGEDIQAG